MIVGCYSLHLYCDAPDPDHHKHGDGEPAGEFTGQSEADCIKRARWRGWTVNKRLNKALCPKHSGKRPLMGGSNG